MNNPNNLSITIWAKLNYSIQKMSDELELSRPTIYKYMEYYDDGNREAIPDKVVAYFDSKLSDTDTTSMLEVKIRYKEKLLSLDTELLELSRKKIMLDTEFQYTEDDYQQLSEEERNSEKANILSKRKNDIKSELYAIELRQSTVREEIARIGNELNKLGDKESTPTLEIKEDHRLMTAAFFDGNKYMVVHDGDANPDYRYMLSLYVKIGSEFILISEYYAVDDSPSTYEPNGPPGKMFFIINDVVFTAPLYYKVEQWTCDPEPFYQTTGVASAMCELKQSTTERRQ